MQGKQKAVMWRSEVKSQKLCVLKCKKFNPFVT